MKKLKRILLLGLAVFTAIYIASLLQPKNTKADVFDPAITISVDELYIYQNTDFGKCYAPGCLETGRDIMVEGVLKINRSTWKTFLTALNINSYKVYLVVKVNGAREQRVSVNAEDGTFEFNIGELPPGSHTLEIIRTDVLGTKVASQIEVLFGVKDSCVFETACVEKNNYADRVFNLCQQISGTDSETAEQLQKCINCTEQDGVWTALGCIPTKPDNMMKVIIKIGLLIGGGVATLIILAGSFMLSISQGDPQKTSEAKEMITAAIIGLIFIIFSVSILQLIGVQILQIPEFGR